MDEISEETYQTKRITVPSAEKILRVPFSCLDYGFLTLVDYMGSDESIVEAARVSYQKGTRKISDDKNLIRYLLRHKHTTPFEMVEIKFHAKMPIFVARQWVRHRTASINEESLRYSEPCEEYYVPALENICCQSKDNKQGRSEELPAELSRSFQDDVKKISNQARMIRDKYSELGMARELSRIVLPVNQYSQWYWKANLHNIFNFLRLRMDLHAQYEIRVYANAMAEIVKNVAPIAYDAFEDYILNAVNLTKLDQKTLRLIIQNGKMLEEALNETMSTKKREREEFEKKLDSILSHL